jgi:GEVED domain/Secretion system C-terminal sorting domain
MKKVLFLLLLVALGRTGFAACSGTPTAGTATSTVSGICSSSSGIDVPLKATGYTTGSGITYQWYSRASGSGPYSPISGATSSTYTDYISSPTDYVFVATCSGSGLSDTSVVLTIGYSPFYSCYCGPTTDGTTLEYYSYYSAVDSISIPGTALHWYSHGDYALEQKIDSTGASDSMAQGTSHTIVVNVYNEYAYSYKYNAYAWIDYDHSGTFDASELIFSASSVADGTRSSGSFFVPGSADTGLTGLRVRGTYYSYTLSDACGYAYYGTTRDFLVDITAGVACSGRPSAGVATSTVVGICASSSGINVPLTDSGFTTGSGLTYQWYSRASGSGSFSPISGATTPSYTDYISSATDYIFVITCASSGLSDTTAVLTIGSNPFYLCYCAPSTDGTTLESYAYPYALTDSVCIQSTSLNWYSPGDAVEDQEFYPTTPSTTTTLSQGAFYSLYVNVYSGYSYAYNYNAYAWIDYDHSGTFDASEEILMTSTTLTDGTPTSASFIVPSSADTGVTGFRVRGDYYYTIYDACGSTYYGTTRDFVIDIAAGVPCTGRPNAGVVTSTVYGFCPASSGLSVPLSDSGFSTGLGITYQWYSSSGGSAYSAISGATGPTYTDYIYAATKYIFVATCDSSGISDTSNVWAIDTGAFYLCYCAPSTDGTTLEYYTYTYALTDSVSIAGTSLNWYSPGDVIKDQEFYPPTASTTTSLSQGSLYDIYVNVYSGYSYSYNYNAYAWIDYDHSGTFDASEEILMTSSTVTEGTPTYASFIVPSSADTGITGLRVRGDYYYSISDACGSTYYGTTRDFVVNLRPGIPCTGTPNAGVASSTIAGFCSTLGGTNVPLSDTGFTTGYGIEYQWYSRASGSGPYTAVSGATTNTFTDYITSPTDYVFVVKCDSSGSYDTSNVVTIGYNPFYVCYCGPSGDGTTLDYYYYYSIIDSVAIAGTSLDTYTPGSTSIYVSYYPPTSTETGALHQGDPYSLWIDVYDYYGYSYGYNAGAWIDYDHSGTYDASEYIFLASDHTISSPANGVFFVPPSADTGFTGMRVRATYYSYTFTATDACTEEYYGTVRDFVVNILPGVPCSGLPSAGVAAASDTSSCPAGGFTLSDTGYSFGTGLSFQWQSSPSGSGTWTAISGATLPIYTVTSIDTVTDYRLVVKCDTSGLTDSSNVVTVTLTPFLDCYCSLSTTDYTYFTDISAVSVSPSSFSMTAYTTVSYVVYPASDYTGTFYRTFPYTISMTAGSYSYYYWDGAAWIDYNHNGVFDASEYIPIIIDGSGGSTYDASFTVPLTADTGLTGMRVRSIYYYDGIADTAACTPEYYSQTFDFQISIAIPTPCSGAPTAGAIYASTGNLCDTSSLTVVDTGYTLAGGLTWQWQISSDSTHWTSVSGATDFSYYSDSGARSRYVYYRCVVTCGTSGLSDTTNHLVVDSTPCYCTAPVYLYSPTSYCMSSFSLNGYASTSISDAGINTACDPSDGYLDRTGTITPIQLQQGGAYAGTLAYTYGSYYYENQIWIDFNDDGVFDPVTDTVTRVFGYAGTTYSYTYDTTFTVIVPTYAPVGLHRMRVRNAYGYLYGSSGSTSMDPCAESDGTLTYYYGDVVDYMVDIIALPPCSGAPTAGGAFTTVTTVCPLKPFLLQDTGYTHAGGLSFQWYASPTGAGTYTAISGATLPYYTVASQTSATDYVFVVKCDTSGLYDTSNIVTVLQNTFYTCYCSLSTIGTPSSGIGFEDIILASAIPGTSFDCPEQYPGTDGYVAVAPGPGTTDTFVATHTYTMVDTVDASGYSIVDMGMWIDYDHSGTFDASEFTDLTASSDGSYWSHNFTVPTSALPGLTGMRITADLTGSISDACSEMTSGGEVLDFDVYIVNGVVPCDSVVGLTSYGITDTSATIRWDSVSGASGYDYVVNTTPGAPTGSGTFTTHNTVTITGLSAGVTYYAHVRTSCFDTTSGWETISFTVAACGTVMGLANFVTETSTKITWDSVVGIYGYDYVINDSASAPTTAGTFTTNAFATGSGFAPGTTYFAHVRIKCTDSSNSAWATISFTTASCDTILGLAAAANDTGAVISWTEIAGSAGYQYVIDNTATSPTGSGTYTTHHADTATGLTPGLVYYAHVRDSCADGYTSPWVTVKFELSPCDSVSGLTAFTWSDSTAVISWLASVGCAGYQYAVDGSASSPSSGTPTTSTVDSIDGGLVYGTIYYAHVRINCGAGTYSAWVTIPFHTEALSVGSVSSASFDVLAFPNPAKDVVSVKIDGAMSPNSVVELTDITGKVLQQVSMTNHTIDLNMNNLAAGLYLIKYQDDAHTRIIKVNKQ